MTVGCPGRCTISFVFYFSPYQNYIKEKGFRGCLVRIAVCHSSLPLAKASVQGSGSSALHHPSKPPIEVPYISSGCFSIRHIRICRLRIWLSRTHAGVQCNGKTEVSGRFCLYDTMKWIFSHHRFPSLTKSLQEYFQGPLSFLKEECISSPIVRHNTPIVRNLEVIKNCY